MMQLFDSMNVFGILGDLSHGLAICGLIYILQKRKSSEEISLKSQCLLALVFLLRYAGTTWPTINTAHGRHFGTLAFVLII